MNDLVDNPELNSELEILLAVWENEIGEQLSLEELYVEKYAHIPDILDRVEQIRDNPIDFVNAEDEDTKALALKVVSVLNLKLMVYCLLTNDYLTTFTPAK